MRNHSKVFLSGCRRVLQQPGVAEDRPEGAPAGEAGHEEAGKHPAGSQPATHPASEGPGRGPEEGRAHRDELGRRRQGPQHDPIGCRKPGSFWN